MVSEFASDLFQKNYDEDHSAKKAGKKSLTPVDQDKKRGPTKQKLEGDELLRKRLMLLYKSVHDYAVCNVASAISLCYWLWLEMKQKSLDFRMLFCFLCF